MKKNILFMLLAIVILSSNNALAQQNAQCRSCSESYIPTRFEMLLLDLTASLTTHDIASDGFVLKVTSPANGVVMLYVVYMPHALKGSIDISLNAAKQVIQMTSKRYGLAGQIKVIEKVVAGDAQ